MSKRYKKKLNNLRADRRYLATIPEKKIKEYQLSPCEITRLQNMNTKSKHEMPSC